MYSWEKYECAVIVSVSFSELIERANCIHVPLKIFDKRFAWKKGAWIKIFQFRNTLLTNPITFIL